MKLLYLGAVIATIIAVVVIASRGDSPEPVRGVVASSNPVKTAPARIEKHEPAAIVPPDTAKPAIDVELRHALSTSRNYREFIAKAKAEVERGGAAYAFSAANQCAAVRATEQEMQKNPPRPTEDTRNIVARAEAKTLLDARCGPLTDQELDMLANYRSMRTNGDFQRDPLMAIWNSAAVVAARNDPAARRRYVEQVLDAQDPLLWDRSPGTIVSADPKTGKAYFDGTVYDTAQEPALLVARNLVVCGIGYACDAANDTQVAIACLQFTICEHDRFELEKRRAETKGFAFDRVMLFYDRMVAAFKEKRVDAFVPPA